MSIFDGQNTIKLLENLLKPKNESSDSEDDDHLPSTGVHRFGPGNIANKKNVANESKSNEIRHESIKNYVDPYKQINNPNIQGASSIEEWEEKQIREDTDILESRETPEYTISYKQIVSTEDVFLQMGNKTGATSSCEYMLIDIELPNESVGIEEMDLSVSSNEIDLQTPVYRLRLPLVQPIFPDMGNAKYDNNKKRLMLQLKMNREFDFVNF